MVVIVTAFFGNAPFGKRKYPVMGEWKNNLWHVYAVMEMKETKLHVSI